MKRRMEQRRLLPSNRIIPIVSCWREIANTTKYRVPCPVLGRGGWALDLSVARGEFSEGYQGTSTGGVVEWEGAVEVGDGAVN